MISTWSRRPVGTVLITAAVLLAACKSSDPVVVGAIDLVPATSTLILVRGHAGTVTVAITRTNLTDTISLSVTGAPDGVIATFDSARVTGSASTLTLAVGTGVTAATYNLTLSAVAGAVSKTTVIQLKVFDYDLTLSSPNLFVERGSNATATITIVRPDSNLEVILAVTGAPRDVMAFIIRGTPTAPTATLAIGVGSTAPPGTYQLQLSVSNGFSPGPVPLTLTVTGSGGGSTAAQVSADGVSCVIATTSQLYCWGGNSVGQVGDGTRTGRQSPTRAAAGLTFVQVKPGSGHTCGVATGGTAYCWGEGFYGAIGDGTTADRILPTAVSGGLTFSMITAAANPERTCGLTITGAGYCWGVNPHGEYGDGTTIAKITPTPVAGGLTFKYLSTAETTTCGLTVAGAAYCWGYNDHGQVGNGTKYTSSNNWQTPTAVSGGFTFASLSVGSQSACGLTAAGVAYCWGDNEWGLVGDGTTTDRLVPTLAAGGLAFTSISLSRTEACGVAVGGIAYCWGTSVFGELGDGTRTSRPVPGPVAGGLTFATISVGNFHVCGITVTGSLFCWGIGGDVGDGTGTTRTTPTAVAIP